MKNCENSFMHRLFDFHVLDLLPKKSDSFNVFFVVILESIFCVCTRFVSRFRSWILKCEGKNS